MAQANRSGIFLQHPSPPEPTSAAAPQGICDFTFELSSFFAILAKRFPNIPVPMMAFLRLIRFKNLLIIALLQFLLRYGLLLPVLHFYGISPVLPTSLFVLMCVATLTMAASGNVINDYFDVRIDRVNRPESVIVGHYIPRRTVLLLHVLFTMVGVICGLFLSFWFRKESYALLFVVLPVVLWFYSTSLKKQMLIGNIVIALLTALVPYLVVSLEFSALERHYGHEILESEACSTAWFWTTGFAFFAFITNLIREIIKDMEDVKGDRLGGCHTLPIEMGMVNSKWVVNLLSATMAIALWLIYLLLPQMTQIKYVLPYLILLTCTIVLMMGMVHRARRTADFRNAGRVGKIMMLCGILFIFLLSQLFAA